MSKQKIIHFVGFVTKIEMEEFGPWWYSYAGKLTGNASNVRLDELTLDSADLFRFISRHECNADEFNFTFAKEADLFKFPERKARAVQLGGYIPLTSQPSRTVMSNEANVIAMAAFGESLPVLASAKKSIHSNVYEAYFENCTYKYVAEYILPRRDALDFATALKENRGMEAGIYTEHNVSGRVKEVSRVLL
jgi:hypothetical protein